MSKLTIIKEQTMTQSGESTPLTRAQRFTLGAVLLYIILAITGVSFWAYYNLPLGG